MIDPDCPNLVDAPEAITTLPLEDSDSPPLNVNFPDEKGLIPELTMTGPEFPKDVDPELNNNDPETPTETLLADLMNISPDGETNPLPVTTATSPPI